MGNVDNSIISSTLRTVKLETQYLISTKLLPFHISVTAVQSIASSKKSSISCYLFSLQTFRENLFNLGASAIFPLVRVYCRLLLLPPGLSSRLKSRPSIPEPPDPKPIWKIFRRQLRQNKLLPLCSLHVVSAFYQHLRLSMMNKISSQNCMMNKST
ncbi:uncharacterized protein LOC128033808 [Gossypium raimondii]|uniref:uncharacterized protein LOC128033808 n=1 Tax=Gossypium raimondii TaxID=29730 RepID=UPI00227A1790|nr:uncharacterized protein LOC128033808 [Gossypium raimondii]